MLVHGLQNTVIRIAFPKSPSLPWRILSSAIHCCKRFVMDSAIFFGPNGCFRQIVILGLKDLDGIDNRPWSKPILAV